MVQCFTNTKKIEKGEMHTELMEGIFLFSATTFLVIEN